MWGSWNVGSCSKSCGGGKKTKTRRKTVTEKYNGKCEELEKNSKVLEMKHSIQFKTFPSNSI